MHCSGNALDDKLTNMKCTGIWKWKIFYYWKQHFFLLRPVSKSCFSSCNPANACVSCPQAVSTRTMPVAAPNPQDPGVPSQYLPHLLPKPPGAGCLSDDDQQAEAAASGYTEEAYDYGGLASSTTDEHEPYFNPHSPPILNLSPNLSPAESARSSPPGYDLRDSTRRRVRPGECSLFITLPAGTKDNSAEYDILDTERVIGKISYH